MFKGINNATRTFVTGLILTLIPLAAMTSDSRSIPVFVDVSGQNTETIESLIKRELRTIGDVVLVNWNDDYEYKIKITGVPTIIGDRDYGHAISVLYLSPVAKYHPLQLTMFHKLDSTKAVSIADEINMWYLTAVHFEANYCITVPKESSGLIIRDLISRFDLDFLEKVRSRYRMLDNLGK